MNQQTIDTHRRMFLQSTVTGLLLLKPKTVFGYQANSNVEIGIVGCGGRGNYVGDFFVEYTGAKVVALADPVEQPLHETGQRWKVESDRLYGAVDGYKRLAESKLDAILVMSPPFFHPEQAQAAADAGKHVYLAKPVAVDTAGCLSIIKSGNKLKNKRSFWVDFQTRAQPVFQDLMDRVHRGDIGEIPSGQTYYETGIPKIKSGVGLDPLHRRLREWLGDKVLSGDIIVEQHVHTIDVGNWYFNTHPLKAAGSCGRKVRTVGNCNDFFIVTFFYPNGIEVDHNSVQFTKGFNDICARAFGSKGTADAHYNGLVQITGDNAWHGADKDDTFRSGAIANAKKFVENIRAGTPINNADTAAESTLTAILGRTAAYRGHEVIWEDLIRELEKYEFEATSA
jgi:myo-inositol 2-dehydrogenase / D-chiro-inositol 1-dehydrogenase